MQLAAGLGLVLTPQIPFLPEYSARSALHFFRVGSELEIAALLERVGNILKMFVKGCVSRAVPGHFEDISHAQF